MPAVSALRNLCAFIVLLALVGCASRESPFVLRVAGTEQTSSYWNPPHASGFHVQTFTTCANEERAVTSFELPPEGDFSIFGYKVDEDRGLAKVTLHHVSFRSAQRGRSGASSADGGAEVLGKLVVGAFFPVFVAAAIVVAPIAVVAIVDKEIHKPRRAKDVPGCYTWVEDASGTTVSGEPPFRGVSDS